MQYEDKELQNLFSSAFENEEDYHNHTEGWMAIEQKLSLINFFKFSWLSFNVYYAAAILASFLLSAGVAGHYILTLNEHEEKVVVKTEIKSQEKNNIVLSEEVEEIKATPPVPVIVRKEDIKQKLSGKVKQLAPKQYPASSEMINSKEIIKIDSTKSEKSTPNLEEATKTETKKVVIVKQDTIINYDSVRVKPKFLFFGKEK